jgi:Protein of unknown function (DUF1236)
VADKQEESMRRYDLRMTIAVLVLVGGASLALAQQAPPPEPQQRTQQEQWQHTPSGKHGKEEPSSHAPTSKPQDDTLLVNGALAVPGAPADIDTVPAKFSEKKAADDELITIAYTFKSLSDDNRRAIYQKLKDQAAASTFNADIGTQLPPTVELHAMPDDVAKQIPQTRDHQYTVAHDRVLLVSPLNRIVVGVFAAGSAAEATVGKR